jgi:hypothetical protein
MDQGSGMKLARRLSIQARSLALTLAFTLCACGGGNRTFGPGTPLPISARLSSSTVVVSPDGTPTYVQILISSTSETAVVNFAVMPSGVQATYRASDTNPSGLLTFMVTSKATAGTYMPIITVNSAQQTTMIGFTLIVPAK